MEKRLWDLEKEKSYLLYRDGRLALADMAKEAGRNPHYDLTIYNQRLKQHIVVLNSVSMEDYLSFLDRFESEHPKTTIFVKAR